MKRTQIQLTEEQHRALKRWASMQGISMSEAIRRCVDERLSAERDSGGRSRLVREVLGVAGKYGDPGGRTDVAREHDQTLNEAYE